MENVNNEGKNDSLFPQFVLVTASDATHYPYVRGAISSVQEHYRAGTYRLIYHDLDGELSRAADKSMINELKRVCNLEVGGLVAEH